MATINITEANSLAALGGTTAQLALGTPFTAVQNHTLTTTSTTSNAFNASTRFVSVNADAACFIVFGTTTASLTASVTNGTRILTGETRYFGVVGGGVVSAITP